MAKTADFGGHQCGALMAISADFLVATDIAIGQRRCRPAEKVLHGRHEVRIGVVDSPRSKNQGYWSHLDNVTGNAADEDHAAMR